MTAAGISYMGTKRELAGAVATIISNAKQGVLLDAFAGMGAVAQAASKDRNVWLNDVQRFAHLIAKCVFVGRERPKSPSDYSVLCHDAYSRHLKTLRELNSQIVSRSESAIAANTFSSMNEAYQTGLSAEVQESDYSCFLQRYRAGFFSDFQAIQIDAIRFALDQAKRQKALTHNQWQWGIASLGRACLKVANTPGHFAQFLRPSPTNYKRVQKQWRRDVWDEWLLGFSSMRCVGTSRWRQMNKATNEDSLSLLANLTNKGVGVVYCDPPYTDDQYSRYYHIWETLVEYDYPVVSGAGKYRPGRFTTPFSIKSKAVSAMTQLTDAVASCGADLVLSYPSNGLVYEAGGDPEDILRAHFRRVDVALSVDHQHSTFGASKGSAKEQVRELVYLASQRRR